MSVARPDRSAQLRKIALFGGTFDPIHSGHLRIARAARRQFHLDTVYFIPSARPPHKAESPLTPFAHRYAMVAMACAGEKAFVPSLAEGSAAGGGNRAYYSIYTVTSFRRKFPGDRIYFILGADSFLQIATWHRYESVLNACDFIVASRPGFRMDKLQEAIPRRLLGRTAQNSRGSIALRNSSVYLLSGLKSSVSSTEIRKRLRRGESIRGMAPSSAIEYIRKEALYQ
jgi:nicotinate-nucleotide adenylyltransferase